MKRALFVSILLLLSSMIYSQGDTAKMVFDTTDVEQNFLGKCYYYSHKLGFPIDTITNENLYKTACLWLLTPYHWGGRSKKGIDCSDFASIIYDSCYNINISGACDDIYRDVFPIKKSELREGDLLFFKIHSRSISHVGVYLGKNKFIHASSAKGVVVSDLDEPYYKKFFFSAGRHKCF
jgi:lipoprotein Spr